MIFFKPTKPIFYFMNYQVVRINKKANAVAITRKTSFNSIFLIHEKNE